jgi:transcriptional regulator with XRE-family HTH domain
MAQSRAGSRWKGICFSEGVRLDRETFGPVLRAARERRGVTLKQLAAETKISVELWSALEDSNLAKWPKQLFARSHVRDYAVRVGLDPDEVVNEFCRLFPHWGDRRAERLMRGQAAIISHSLQWEDMPVPHRRRASDRAAAGAPGVLVRHSMRLLAVAVDLMVLGALALLGAFTGVRFWTALALAAVAYNLLATVTVGRSLGQAAAEWVVRTVKAIPAARRLVSSRAEGA